MRTPATFDPAGYVADMRAIGAVLTPFATAGRRIFSITGRDAGVPGAVMAVAEKWGAAAQADPDWMGAVHDALAVEARS